MPSLEPPSGRAQTSSAPLWRIVSALGTAQIISWGTLYYSLTVLSVPIEAELLFTKLVTFGAFTLGLLVSGVVAPAVGRRIDREGGRTTMSAGSLTAAIALVVIASAREPLVFTLGWVIAGIAMGATLYDPVFASLFRIAGSRYRKAVTGLTLFGGFASTVFWPLSHALASAIGWRLVFSAVSAFIISALTSRGFSTETAVWIAALVGPMQVAARAIEWFVAPRVSAIAVGALACVLSLVSMVVLASAPGGLAFGLMFAICYGASNGILTIARGAVPVELFGAQRHGEMLGALARPSFLTKALAPALFAGGLSIGITMQTQLFFLAAASAAALACYWVATRHRAALPIAYVNRSTSDG